MKVLVTGSSGLLGEALVRRLREVGHEDDSLDIRDGPFTTRNGTIADPNCDAQCMTGVQWVFHAATLHRPHIDIYSRQDFVDTNITGTLALLEQAAAACGESFVFTSTTSVFGDALVPPAGAAAWVTEEVRPIPKNIYGVTKAAAEDLCQLFHRNQGLPCIVLRTSRFFPEEDLDDAVRAVYADDNLKVSEYLYRRVDLEDAVGAHLLAAERAGTRLPALHHQRDDAVPARRSAGPAHRRRSCSAAPRPRLRGRICAPRLDNGSKHRPRLRQRTGAQRARLAAALRFRVPDRPSESGRRPEKSAGPPGRVEGISMSIGHLWQPGSAQSRKLIVNTRALTRSICLLPRASARPVGVRGHCRHQHLHNRSSGAGARRAEKLSRRKPGRRIPPLYGCPVVIADGFASPKDRFVLSYLRLRGAANKLNNETARQ